MRLPAASWWWGTPPPAAWRGSPPTPALPRSARSPSSAASPLRAARHTSTVAHLEGRAMRYTIRPLDASTWAAFAELVERNNGIFGGCWCMGYHPEDSRTDAAHNRAAKERRVHEGRAHAALVIDEDGSVQGWCQYGSPGELPGIKHRREYDKTAPRGGGLVEAISEVTASREAQGRFLFSATVELFEQNGFTRVRQVGKHAWIVSKV